jgi:arylsulfatase A-like enzyme
VRSVVPEEVWFLSEHLDKHGFQTAAISANTVIKGNYGFEQGWDFFKCVARSERVDGEYVFADAIEWLEKNAKAGRFLLYLQTMECHSPYAVDRKYSALYHPEPYEGRLGPTFESVELVRVSKEKMKIEEADFDWIRALYYGEATYHDEHMGRLLDALDRLGLLDDTMVVITNDHGEELYEHQGMGHTWTSYEELLRAPLVVYFPPLFPPGKRFEEVVEQVDMAPTIVDALGLPPMPDVDGESLLPLTTGQGDVLRPYYAVADFRTEVRIIRVGRWKLEVDHRSGWESLYDLVADPGETEDRKEDRVLAGRFAEVYLGEALAAPRKAERLLTVSQRRELKESNVKLDPETRKALKANGYIDGTDKPKKKRAH